MSYQIGLNGTSGATRAEHKQLIQELLGKGLLIDVKGQPDQILEGMDVIIAHDPLPNGYRRPEGQWKIETGGNHADRPSSEQSMVGRISWETLMLNLEQFLNQFGERADPISKEAIAVLYAIDSKLEKLLAPFATTSPFKAPSQAAKTSLDAYIEEKRENAQER